jgi:cbb3-type cytochrome oxidase cytochrome c subunit
VATGAEMKAIFIYILTALVVTGTAYATAHSSIKTIGHEETVVLDTSEFSPQQLEGNKLLKKYCTTCHSQQRIISTISEWLTTDDEQYEELLKSMMTKKIRFSNGSLTKADSQKIYDLLLSFHTK